LRPAQAVQVIPLGVVQLKRRGECVEDVHRRAAAAPLLESGVIVDAHARQLRQFLAAQTRDAPSGQFAA
jgi:hypothetical protein